MRSVFRTLVVAAALVSLVSCRQADGSLPTPPAEIQEELKDVARDLQNIASARDPQAASDLQSDLRKYVRRKSATPAVEELARRTATAINGVNLGEQDAQRLTHNLWLVVSAVEISGRQVEGLQNDVQSLLVSVGTPQDRAEQVAAQVGQVQQAVTDRPRRWYEFF